MRMTASWSGPCGRPNTRVWRADPRPMASSPLIVDGFRRAPCPRVSGQGPMTARVTAPWMVGRRDQPNRAAVLLGTLQGSQGWKLNLVRQGPKRQQWPGRKPSRPKPLDIKGPIQGLLRLHARYGLLDCSTAQSGLRHEASARPVTRPSRSSATRSYRQLPGWILPPLVNRAVGAHRIDQARRVRPPSPPESSRVNLCISYRANVYVA